MTIGDADLCDRYAALYPGAVTDVLDRMGYGSRALPSAIGPLTDDTRMAGIAYPVHGYPDESSDYEENMRRFLRMLGDAPAESVVVYETRDEEAAHIGELSTTALRAQGFRCSAGTKPPPTPHRAGASRSGASRSGSGR